MKQKLRVPPPPAGRTEAARGPARPTNHSPAAGPRREPGQPPRRPSRRRPASGCGPPLTAGCLVLLAIGVAVAVIWSLMSGTMGADGGRTNLLLLGIDRRDGTGWTYRTDTIMILTMDRDSGAAGLLSIPRDLQLSIPTYGEDRINTANVWGDLRDYPGGGPALLEATIAANFNVPIDGYLMIDFQTFEQIVDSLGGIDVDVPRALHDTRYPDPRPGDPYAYKTVHFDAGPQHMDGRRALEYARSRMSTTDFDRAGRQQQVLLAIRDKALRLGSIPRWPGLAASLTRAVKTDLSLKDMAGLALAVDPSHLQQVVLQPPLVYGYQRADGAAVQLPNWELINPVLDELFGRQ